MNKLTGVIIFLMALNYSFGQFAPAANQPGTTAVHKDSSAIVNWASEVIFFQRGASDIANGWSVLTSFGTETNALGPAEGSSTEVVSLGDSGSIVLGFPYPIMNGPGPDFAVFENSFSDDYLEFAFVEVSSDGINFVRFPATSLVQTSSQTDAYSNTETELINNLAGKYKQGYGTPFDLNELSDSAALNLDSIRFVKLIDVVGSIDPLWGSADASGNLINDPYPTDFASGGFDLDAVAVINENNIYAGVYESNESKAFVFPNPSNGYIYIEFQAEWFDVIVYDFASREVGRIRQTQSGAIDLSYLPAGIYTLVLVCNEGTTSEKIVIQN